MHESSYSLSTHTNYLNFSTQRENTDHQETCSFYLKKSKISVLLHVRDFQVLQDHSAVTVGLDHVQVVVFFRTQQV